MSEAEHGSRGLVERAIELFNRDMNGEFELGADARAIWADEPVIVPFRAALEAIEYRGPGAIDDVVAASAESWSELRLESKLLREIDAQRILMTGYLVGRARETGLEVRAPIALLWVIRDGRIAEVRTYASEQEALAAGEP